MSLELISRSSDLSALCEDGYEVAVRGGFLVLTHVPYLNANREVRFGSLASPLTLAGDVTSTPGTHVVHFQGDYPCNLDGTPIEAIRHQSGATVLAEGLSADHTFSNKPVGGFQDYHQLMTSYSGIVSGPAESVDPTATAKTFKTLQPGEESVFRYVDTASSRADIATLSRPLTQDNVAIVGLGGTGAYVLDLLAKTPIKTIHLFDGDHLLSHNAFRSPGAASLEQLRKAPYKVDYFRETYDRMRANIMANPVYIDENNIHQLINMDFVFVCVDRGPARKLIVATLERAGVSFIDVGMGVHRVGDQLLGVLRVTASTPQRPADFLASTFIPCEADTADNGYGSNIQIADLNAINAALAVIRWKKAVGFYQDLQAEHQSTYTTNVHLLTGDASP